MTAETVSIFPPPPKAIDVDAPAPGTCAVSDERFATTISNPAPYLVVLNSCQSAQGDGQSPNPFSGLAEHLINKNVPYVVFMQNLISVDAAIKFSEGFYSSLAEGQPVVQAVTSGRISIFANSKIEASTPVLYTTKNPPELALHTNQQPVAKAICLQNTVKPDDIVTLDGRESSDPDGDELTYLWTQIEGPQVTLITPNSERPTFIAPDVMEQMTVAFELIVNDGQLDSEPHNVSVDLLPALEVKSAQNIGLDNTEASKSKNILSQLVDKGLDKIVTVASGLIGSAFGAFSIKQGNIGNLSTLILLGLFALLAVGGLSFWIGRLSK